MTGPETHLSRHRLEALAADEADEGARAHLGGCATCAARLAKLEEARAAYARAFPAASFARAVLARAPRPFAARLRRWLTPRTVGLGVGLAAACAALLLWLRPHPDVEDGIRYKGQATLQVFARRGGAVRELTDGAAVAPGDQLAFGYVLPRGGYLVLWGRDRSGEMTRWFPTPGAPPAFLAAGRGQLPVGVELDAAPGDESFFVVVSAAPVDDEVARRAIAGAAPAGVQVIALRFEKR